MRRSPKVITTALGGIVVIGVLVAACSSPPTAGTGSAPEDAPGAATSSEEALPADEITRAETLDQLYAALDGLEGDEREARLVELAQAEEDAGIPFLFYFSVQEGLDWIAAFEDEYGIPVEVFHSSQDNVLERILQEHEAGFADGADLIVLGEDELSTMSSEGILLPVESPYSEDILPSLVHDEWIGVYVTLAVPAWNTGTERPDDWVDMLTNHSEHMFIEVTDWDMFATIVLDWLVPEMGMTEEEAIALFADAAPSAAGGTGHTFATQLVVSGEYDIAPYLYTTRIEEFQAEGAPIEWEPAIEPVVVRPNGVGIHHLTDRPATSQLLMEWFLSDSQEMMLDQFTTPASTAVGADTAITKYDSIPLRGSFTPDFDTEYWRQTWENEVVNRLGGGIVEEPGD